MKQTDFGEYPYLEGHSSMSQQEIAVLEGPSSAARSVTYSPDGTQLVTLLLFTYSPDGTQLATAVQTRLFVFGIQCLIKRLLFWRAYVLSVTYSPDGTQLATASDDKTVRVWDSMFKRLLFWKVTLLLFEVWRILLMEHNWQQRVMTLFVFGIQCLQEITVLEGHSDWVLSVTYSPDGTQLATSSDKTVRVWDSMSHQEIAVLSCVGILGSHHGLYHGLYLEGSFGFENAIELSPMNLALLQQRS